MRGAACHQCLTATGPDHDQVRTAPTLWVLALPVHLRTVMSEKSVVTAATVIELMLGATVIVLLIGIFVPRL